MNIHVYSIALIEIHRAELVIELTLSKIVDDLRHGVEILDEPASTISDGITDRHSTVSNEAVGRRLGLHVGSAIADHNDSFVSMLGLYLPYGLGLAHISTGGFVGIESSIVAILVEENGVGKDVALGHHDRLCYRLNHDAESTGDEVDIGTTSIQCSNKLVNSRAGAKGRITETFFNLSTGRLDNGQTSSESIFELGIALHCLECPGGNLFTLSEGGRENILRPTR